MTALLMWCGATWLLVATPASTGQADADIDIAVIAHPALGSDKLSRHELEAIFSRSQRRWSNGVPAVPLNAPPGSALREAFDSVVLGLDPRQVGRYWLDRRIRGLGLPPKQVSDAGLLLRVIPKLRGAIGYVESARIGAANVLVVARIRHGKVVQP